MRPNSVALAYLLPIAPTMKIALRLLAALLVLVLAVAALLWFLFDGEQVRPQLENQLSSVLGRPVSIAELELSLTQGQLVAREIVIADDPEFSEQPFVQAAELSLSVAWWPLVSQQQLRIRSLRLHQPHIALRQNAAADWNFASLGLAAPGPAQPVDAASADFALRVDELRIEQGQVAVTLSDGRERSYEQVLMQANDVAAELAFPVLIKAQSPGGGSVSIDGKLGPWRTGNAVLTPLRAELNLLRFDLAGSGLVGAEAGVAGLLDFAGRIDSDQGQLQMEGRLQAQGLQLMPSAEPLTVPMVVDYQASYDLNRRRGQLSKGSLGTGASGIALAGDFVQTDAGLALDLRANANDLAVDDVQALLPAFGIALPEQAQLAGGTLGVAMQMKGTLDRLEVAGPVQLSETTMVGFSLGDALSAALSIVGVRAPGETRIERADLILRSNPSGMRIGDLNARIAALGDIRGEGRVAADGALDMQLQLKLDEELTQSGGLLGSSGARVMGFASRSGVGIKVGGSLDQPSFVPDQSTVANAVVSGLLGSRREADAPESEPEEVVGSLFEAIRGKEKRD